MGSNKQDNEHDSTGKDLAQKETTTQPQDSFLAGFLALFLPTTKDGKTVPIGTALQRRSTLRKLKTHAKDSAEVTGNMLKTAEHLHGIDKIGLESALLQIDKKEQPGIYLQRLQNQKEREQCQHDKFMNGEEEEDSQDGIHLGKALK